MYYQWAWLELQGGVFSEEFYTCNLCTVCVYYQWAWLELGAYSQKSYAHATCVLCVYYQWAWLELGGVFSEDKPANLSLRKEGGRQC